MQPAVQPVNVSADFASRDKHRVEWVDCCKGICILLVVYGHIVGGLNASHVVAPGSIYETLRDWVYVFHIPAFFFLSGLFAGKLCGRPFAAFLGNRLRALAYPYFVWTAIVLASQFAMGSVVNTPPSFTRALRCLWEPYGVGLWFLYSLFLCSLLFYALCRARAPKPVILLIGVVGYIVGQYQVFWAWWYILNESLNHAVFFLIGGCYPALATAPIARARRSWLVAAGVSLLLVMTFALGLHSDPTKLLKLARALIGVAGVILVSIALARTVTAPFWSFLGVSSLEIYLAHPLWGTASRAVLLRLGARDPLLFVVSGVVVGVAGSLAMALACRRLGFPYLFRWPSQRERGAA